MADFEALPAGSRRAMQLALEALEFMADEWGFAHKANRPERWQAIEALRAALAQQEGVAQNLNSRRDAALLLEERRQETSQELAAGREPTGREPADHFPTGGKMVTVEELCAALGWPGGISTPLLDKAVLLQRVSDLAAIGRKVLTALDHGRIEAGDQVAADLRSALTPPEDKRQNQEPSITTADERSCMTCAHMLKGMWDDPCIRCRKASHWERHASAAGSALSRWFGEHRAAGST